MMLPAQGPTSTLMEDFDILGITESKGEPSTKVQQHKEPDEKGGDFAGPPGDNKPGDPGGDVDLDVGDKPAGHYTYVPVRGDSNVGPGGPAGKSRGGAKNEDVSNNGKMVPSFMIPSDEEVQENNETLAEQAEKDQLENAWKVINTYFGEDVDGLNEEGLRGVINAAGFALNVAVEDIAMLSTENERLTEAVNDLNQILKESEVNENYNGKKKDDDKEDDDEGMEYPEGDDKKDKKDDDASYGGKKAMPFGKKAMDYSSEQDGTNLTEDASLNSILSEVASIGGTPKQQAVNAQGKLIEGFEKVEGSASDLVERIVAVIREDEGLSENEEVSLPEGDQRTQVAQFFHSIAEDAQNYLTRLADGDVAFRVAEEDLNRLSDDIQKGIEAMHKIP